MTSLKLLEIKKQAGSDHNRIYYIFCYNIKSAVFQLRNDDLLHVYFSIYHNYVLVFYTQKSLEPGRCIRISGALLIRLLPLMIIMFVFFPRIQGTLWKGFRINSGKAGFSDTLVPGALSDLALTGELAFRVDFKDKNLPVRGVLRRSDARAPRPGAQPLHLPHRLLRAVAASHLSAPLLGIERASVFSFRNRDHGARDGSPLLPWIQTPLRAQGLAELCDGEIVLQTMPRIFGFVFNPVSFWFCHDRAGALRVVLAEVSNTFGERHNYLRCTTSTGARSFRATSCAPPSARC